MSYLYYFYGLAIFSCVVNSHPVLKLNKYDDYEDYDSSNLEFVNVTVEPTSTLEPMPIKTDNKTLASHHLAERPFAVKKVDNGNTTVIIVFVLIVMTIIVKTVPVIIAYSLPYFYGPDCKKPDGENCAFSTEFVNDSKTIANKQITSLDENGTDNSVDRSVNETKDIPLEDTKKETSTELNQQTLTVLNI